MPIFFLLTLLAVSTVPFASADSTGPARAAATKFYGSYLKYVHGLAGRSRSPEEAFKQDRAAIEPRLTSRYAAKLQAQRARCAAAFQEVPPGCDGDPFFCAQEPPVSFRVLKASRTTQSSWVRVELTFGPKHKRTAVVRLDREDGRWLVDRVRCLP